MGVFVYLLPYFEELPAQDRYAATLDLAVDSRDDNYWTNQEAWQVAQWELSLLLCPDLPPTAAESAYIDQIWTRLEPEWIRMLANGWPSEVATLGKTHYLAVSGYFGELGHPEVDARVGVFSIRTKTRLAQITDGASNTLLFGEAPGTIGREIYDPPYDETFSGYVHAHAWAGTGTLPVGAGINAATEDGTPNEEARYDAYLFQYGSLHAGDIVQFCLADGSVRQIDKQIDQAVLEALASIRGGELVPSDAY